MNIYTVTDQDVIAINALLAAGGAEASILRDEVNFEVGILSEEGYMPKAFGSGDTIADAVAEALNIFITGKVTPAKVKRTLDWLREKGVQQVTR